MPRFDRVVADGVSVGTTGIKLSYTAPSSGAVVTGVTVTLSVAATLALQLVTEDSLVIDLRTDTASYRDGVPVNLRPGETLRLNCTIAIAGTLDAMFSVENLY